MNRFFQIKIFLSNFSSRENVPVVIAKSEATETTNTNPGSLVARASDEPVVNLDHVSPIFGGAAFSRKTNLDAVSTRLYPQLEESTVVDSRRSSAIGTGTGLQRENEPPGIIDVSKLF